MDLELLVSCSRTKTLAHVFSTLAILAACGGSTPPTPEPKPVATPDPRVGLRGGPNAGEAVSNLRVLARAASPQDFLGSWNSDIAFRENYAIQGNFKGFVIWDVRNPQEPKLVTSYQCPAQQNDVSVYQHLLFVSVESTDGRTDCGASGVPDTVSMDRMRGLRVFDISDISRPKLVANVQTCRGSHTHTIVEDPSDRDNVYVYISGSATIRSPRELPGCVLETPDKNLNSALMRLEIIKVPTANPERAAVVGRASIFGNLTAPNVHDKSAEDRATIAAARAAGRFVATDPFFGEEFVIGNGFARVLLDSLVKARGGAGPPTSADSATLRAELRGIVYRMFAPDTIAAIPGRPISPYRQCHDITVHSAIGLAAGACEGHGFLMDVRNPLNPVRIDVVTDSNFAYWHSATFNNDGTKVLFTDEWGGGTSPKCRPSDRKEWGADAIFEIENRKLKFRGYYKIPAAQTDLENCVAHNGSLIPIPGRDVMVQGWYQGGVSVFDWTDASRPREIAYFDRGPIDSTTFVAGGSWSAYWYNGVIVSSEMTRGLDVAELMPSEHISQNEIDAAKTVRWSYLNPQSQPRFVWPPTFALVKAYVDQLERSKCLTSDRIASVRQSISGAERATGVQRANMLNQLASQLTTSATSCDRAKVLRLEKALTDLAHSIVQ